MNHSGRMRSGLAAAAERLAAPRTALLTRPRDTAQYTTRIIKASGLLADTKTLLAHWDTTAPVRANLERFRRENLFAKASRARVEDILAIFRHRYLTDPEVTTALVTLVRDRLPTESLDRLLYFHAARADALLHDLVTELLVPLHAQGSLAIDVSEVYTAIIRWVEEGRTTSPWSEPTIRRVVQGLLATLRDFGILEGAVNKRIAPTYLPVEAFAYIAFYLKRHQPSGDRLIDEPDWKLFFLTRDAVERFFVEAHQRGLLEYHAAGRVIRITFPTASLEEYAHALGERAH